MSDERPEPVVRVLFKASCDFEPKVIRGSKESPIYVDKRARVMHLTATRSVSLDIVECYDLLEAKCLQCAKPLGFPADSWWREGHHYCGPCQKAAAEQAAKNQEEYRAASERESERRKELIAAMSPEDQKLFRRVHYSS